MIVATFCMPAASIHNILGTIYHSKIYVIYYQYPIFGDDR